MQNNKSKGFRSFVKEKGYYIVLLLCAAAVGVSGYFLLSSKNRTTPQETPVIATDAPTAGTSEAPSTAASEQTSLPPTRGEAPARIVRPVAGEELTAFAADHLAYNETTRDWRTHEGVDLRAAEGETVVAAADGTVHAVYEDDSLGMTVVLTHGDGCTTYYSNLSEEVPVSAGDTLAAGDALGTVGNTANIETGLAPHLHFAVYRSDAPVDPADFLSTAE